MAANPRPAAPRPHRLEPRYPVSVELRIEPEGAAPATFAARDVSRGGVFLSCDAPLELFSDVRVILDATPVPARVVHIVSVERAQEHACEPGMGLQFEPASPEHREAIHAFVEQARLRDPRPRFPSLVRGADPAAAQADPILGYVLSSIDGERGPEELSELLGLPLRKVEELLGELAQLGVIELVARNAKGTRAAHGPRPTAKPSGARLRELAPEFRAELAALFRRLPGLNHYEALGVTRAAGHDEIRAAFFELSKRYHPDAHFRRSLGDDLPKLERVFARLSEAYSVLSRPASRADYDNYLDRKLTLTRPPPGRLRARARAAAERSRGKPLLHTPALMPEAPHYDSEHPASRELWDSLRTRAARRELLATLRAQAGYEEKHQRWADAAETWQRVCAQDPRDAGAHRQAAMALHHAGGDAEAALELAKRSVDLAPEDAHNRRVLGQLYLACGMKRKARSELETALALQTSTPTLPAAPA